MWKAQRQDTQAGDMSCILDNSLSKIESHSPWAGGWIIKEETRPWEARHKAMAVVKSLRYFPFPAEDLEVMVFHPG